MKNIFYIFIILIIGSCAKSDPVGYIEAKPSIYFDLDEITYTNSISMSFSTTLDSYIIVNIPVKCSGLASDTDRKFKISVLNEESTTTSGIDFEPISSEYIFPKNSYNAVVPITLKKTPVLDSVTLKLTVKLEQNEDFSNGEKLRQKASVKFSNEIVKPVIWDKYNWYLKEWSKVKYILILKLTNRSTFPTQAEWSANSQYWQIVLPRALSGYLFDNYPVYDEKGNIIQPW